MPASFTPRAASAPVAASRGEASLAWVSSAEAAAPSVPLESEPLELPPPWTRPPRAPVPVLASVVPLLGSIALWLATGSVFALWFALLGPLIAGAALLDGARAARRGRRRAESEAQTARTAVALAVVERHRAERARLRAQHPDVAHYVDHDDDVWRPVPGRAEAVVIGSGARPSATKVRGGDAGPASQELRVRASVLQDAPILVPLRAGIAVMGPTVLATAVVRALCIQLCLASPPGELALVVPRGTGEAWQDALPHGRVPGRTTLALLGRDDLRPQEADAVLVLAEEGAPPPPGCAAILTVHAPGRALLDHAGEVTEICIEALAAGQAEAIGRALDDRATAIMGRRGGPAPVVPFATLRADAPTPHRGGLPAVIGHHRGRPAIVDLVADGPHAVVAGVTGSGKSELLITWILALCATHSTAQVSFLLADFKGGTAFDALAAVPHVTGVITDLDGAGARRAIESLRAEVRWREAELARVGARDVLDPRVEVPRLVIVVDEFAALLDGHPELQAVFTDVAARGRALGMHLVLGTQRVVGVVRDALLANCPLRLSLRVTDVADSRAVLGTDQAALLPGGIEGRGTAFVRRAGDQAPGETRIALATPVDIRAVAGADRGPKPRRPWLPELPERVDLAELRHGAADDAIVLGLADEPDRQCQDPASLSVADRGLLIVGGGGTGKTSALRTIAAQSRDAVWLGSSEEEIWDAVAALTRRSPARGTVVLIDDLDALGSRFPHEYAAVVLDRVEALVRQAGDTGLFVVATMRRFTGAAARVAELLPHRAVLTMPSRAEYIAAGGDPAHYASHAPAGRGRLDGKAIQVAFAAAPDPIGGRVDPAAWAPVDRVTGFVGRRSAATRAVLTAWQEGGARIVSLEEAARAGNEAPEAHEGPIVIAGDPDEWQRHWSLLARVRAEHDLVVDAGCGAEYRVIAGDRELPPYCTPGARRAWLRRADGPAGRIVLPTASNPALDRV